MGEEDQLMSQQWPYFSPHNYKSTNLRKNGNYSVFSLIVHFPYSPVSLIVHPDLLNPLPKFM